MVRSAAHEESAASVRQIRAVPEFRADVLGSGSALAVPLAACAEVRLRVPKLCMEQAGMRIGKRHKRLIVKGSYNGRTD